MKEEIDFVKQKLLLYNLHDNSLAGISYISS